MAFDISPVTTATTRTLAVPNANTTLVGTDVAQTLTNKTIQQKDSLFTLQDDSDTTKQMQFQLSGITTATTRTVTVADNDIILDTPSGKWLQTVTASASSVIDITGFNSALYEDYIIVLSGVRLSAINADLLMQMKIGGTLRTTLYFGHQVKTDSGASTYLGQAISAASSLIIADDFGTDDAAAGCDMRIRINNISSTTKQHKAEWKGVLQNSSGGGTLIRFADGAGTCGAATGALSEIRFLSSSGNIVTGTFKLYGMRSV